eukprot:1140629-Pelagomonas_calceolata.AAC.1
MLPSPCSPAAIGSFLNALFFAALFLAAASVAHAALAACEAAQAGFAYAGLPQGAGCVWEGSSSPLYPSPTQDCRIYTTAHPQG